MSLFTSSETIPNKEKVALLAKNLSYEFPRSPRAELGGYVLAGRMLDKCRAVLNGTAGEYHFDCPLDNIVLGFTEMKADEFKEFVATGATDKEVGAWIKSHAKSIPDIERIKWNNQWRDKLISQMPDEIQEYMSTYIPENLPNRKPVHFFFDIFDTEEERI